ETTKKLSICIIVSNDPTLKYLYGLIHYLIEELLYTSEVKLVIFDNAIEWKKNSAFLKKINGSNVKDWSTVLKDVDGLLLISSKEVFIKEAKKYYISNIIKLGMIGDCFKMNGITIVLSNVSFQYFDYCTYNNS